MRYSSLARKRSIALLTPTICACLGIVGPQAHAGRLAKELASFEPLQIIKPATPRKTTAENVDISGTVLDKLGKPVAGVSVKIVGSDKGTSTGEDGRFVIKNVNEKASLEFSHVGFKNQVVAINNTLRLEVTLEAAEGSEQEVVLVGYGRQKKVSLIGAQSTVNVEELKQPVANLSTVLAGRISGLVGVQRTGEPGKDGADLWIRGIATFNGSNDASPLVIIDGVRGRDINSLDPQDVESFTILKDASATAVYGVSGANGVILIKTKSGRPGKTSFNVDYTEGFTTFTKLPKLTDGVTYMNLTNEAMTASGQTPKYSQDYINNTASGKDPLLYPNVDWFKAMFNNLSHNRRFNFSARGGSPNANYYVSMAYYNEAGFLKTDGLEQYNSSTKFQRYNFTSNLNLALTSTTKIELGVQGYITNANYPGVNSSDAFGQAMQITPVLYPIMYPGGYVPGISSNGDQRNPYADITQSGFQTIAGSQLYTNIRATQDLGFWLKGLTFSTMFAYDNYNSQAISRTKRKDTYAPDPTEPRNPDGTLNLVKSYTGNNTLGFTNAIDANHQYYTETSINYDRDFGKSHVGALLLYNQSDQTFSGVTDLVSSIPYRSRGLAGRGTYSWDDKYFAEANFGYNGSENFAPNKRFGFFPSYGVGWVVSREKFFEPVKNVIQFFKLRYSDGKVGSGAGGTRFGYLDIVNSSANGYSFGTSRSGVSGVAISQYGSNITWSTSHKQDLGVELKTLNSKISLIVDFFKEHRTGVFLQRGSLADFAGIASAPYANLGIIDNKGIDATLETLPIDLGKTSWTFRGTFTYARNTVIENDQPQQPFPWMDHRGTNYLATFGYVAEKLFSSQDEIAKSADQSYLSSTIRPGDIKYKDLNGDGVINNNDQKRIGNGDVPNIVYGAGFNVTWKNFTLGAFFQGVAQADRLLGGDGIIPFNNSTGADRSNLYAEATNRWTEANPNPYAFYPRLAYGNSANKNNSAVSSWWVKDISFVRLKTADLFYSLPKGTLKGIGVRSSRIYLQGLNLVTFSKFKLWDPELNTSNGALYPNVRTVSVGFQATF